MFVFVTVVVSEFVTFRLHIPLPAPFVGSVHMILFDPMDVTAPVRIVEPFTIFTDTEPVFTPVEGLKEVIVGTGGLSLILGGILLFLIGILCSDPEISGALPIGMFGILLIVVANRTCKTRTNNR